jgi:UBX domain-containing protein 1
MTTKDVKTSLQAEKNRTYITFLKANNRGISIQNPNQSNAQDEVRNILRTAMNAPAPNVPPPQIPFEPRFSGTGYTLGSDAQPSQPIVMQPASRPTGPIRRQLTLWRNGFTIDDGPLYPFSDPESVEILREIRMGRVPKHVAGVERGEDVEMRLNNRDTEDWVPSGGSSRGTSFVGHGNRLGRYIPHK